MSGTWEPGVSRVRPGVYIRSVNAGLAEQPSVQQGVVAALFRATWGPIASIQALGSLEEMEALYGTDDRVLVAQEALRAGALQVLAYRLDGADEVKATRTLDDTAGPPAAGVVRIDAKYYGTRGNGFNLTVRDSLTDGTKRELLVYEGTTLLQTIEFTKGADGDGEPASLVAAVAAAGSDWITATKLGDGNKLLAAITSQAMASGVDPTITSQSYTDGLAAIEAEEWNVLATDNEDDGINTSIGTYIARVRSEGKRVMAVVAEPTSVAFATRCTNAAALNNPALVYVGNGFAKTDGDYEGWQTTGRIGGMIARTPVTASITHQVIPTGTALVGGLTNAQIEAAIGSGMLVFTLNRAKQVQVEYGITTLVTLDGDQDAGWRKIRRVRTRDNLVERIVALWDPLIGQVSNSPDGRATLQAAAQGVVNAMVREGALLGGTVADDPANPPAGDAAYFLAEIQDLDSAEKIYVTVGFSF